MSEDTAPAEAGAPTKVLPAFTPVPRLKDRSNGWKPRVQQAFIEALADTGSVRAACRRVGRSDHGAYQLRRHPEAESFRAAWEAALDHGVRRIEDVAMDRALNGVEVPVYSYGKLVGSRTVYNDRLLMFILRNRAPHRFAADRARGLSGLDRRELARLKAQWRAEWEAENGGDEQAVLDSIDALIDEMRSRSYSRLGPRAQEAYDRYLAVSEEERAASHRPRPEETGRRIVAAPSGDPEPTAPPPCPGHASAPEPEPEPEQEPGPRVRRLTDDGWG